MIALITSAKYSSPDFSLEFGKIVPAFLPLANKRLYEYQVSLLKNLNLNEIYLSLPQSYKLNKADLKKLEKLNVKIIFAPENLSLGASIVYCLNIIAKASKGVFILHADTFFKNLVLKKDSIFVSLVKENYEWQYLDDEFCLKNKVLKSEKLMINGAFCFSEQSKLIACITMQNYDFIKGVKAYSKLNALKAIIEPSWLDFGLITSYFHSKKVLSTQRSFNDMKMNDHYILKSSTWSEKIKAEEAWFSALSENLSFFVPKVFNHKNSYKIEYICNNTLAELLVFGRLPHFIWRNIFICIKDFLSKLHSIKAPKNLKINYDFKAKTMERLKEFSKQNKFDLKTPLKLEINGVSHNLPSIEKIIANLDKKIKPSNDFVFIHGDFCFSNIMFDFRANSIKTFDPRGIDFSGVLTPFGDTRYDAAKLAHSILGLYDFIIAGFYEVKNEGNFFKFDIEIDEELELIQAEFKQIFNINDEILAIMIHLFLSMLPLHSDDKTRQNALLANALTLYVLYFKDKK